MQKLTDIQLRAIVSLGNNPLISFTALHSHNGGGINIAIISKVNVDWDDVDLALSEIFPDAEYVGKPYHSVDTDGTITELYSITSEYGSIDLHMKSSQKEKDPSAKGSTKENIQPNCNIDLSKIKPLLEQEA